MEKKRLRKRQVKLGLYALLREITGMRPAWGSLTGIRPSRLLYEQMAEGKSPEEAAKALVDVFDVSPSRAALLVELEKRCSAGCASSRKERSICISAFPFARPAACTVPFPREKSATDIWSSRMWRRFCAK